jgi:hypothetical protein
MYYRVDATTCLRLPARSLADHQLTVVPSPTQRSGVSGTRSSSTSEASTDRLQRHTLHHLHHTKHPKNKNVAIHQPSRQRHTTTPIRNLPTPPNPLLSPLRKRPLPHPRIPSALPRRHLRNPRPLLRTAQTSRFRAR